MRTFYGSWPALMTPFTAENTVNVPLLKDLVDYLLSKSAEGFYIGGTTGEGIFTSVEERKLVAETVLRHVAGRVPVIAHIGAQSSVDAAALARFVVERGAVGISSILPALYNSAESLLAYFKYLAAAIPETPLFPYIFGGTIDAETLMQRLADEIPTVAGTKYTGSNMHEFRQIVTMKAEGWTVFSGMDEQCLYALMMGSSGNIGSTLNFMPGVYLNIRRYFAAGEFTRANDLQIRANRVTQVILRSGKMQAALKSALKLVGFDVGAPRLPNLPLTAEEEARLHTDLTAAGFDELAAL